MKEIFLKQGADVPMSYACGLLRLKQRPPVQFIYAATITIFAAMKILMVCLGNICRSPLAEGILRDKVMKTGLNWTIDSAGTNGYQPGCPPHHLSQKVAKHNGVDICAQVCRHFTKEDIDLFDRVYVMDEENYYDVKRISGNKWDEKKVDYLLNEIYPGQSKIVPDPWFGGEADFHKVFELINKACEAIIKKYAFANA